MNQPMQAMAPSASLAEPHVPVDSKTALNQFCQRLCQRPVTRADIEYTVNKIGVKFQAIVKLNCVQGQEFAGELEMSPKDAEKAAASQALKAHQTTAAAMPGTDPRQKKKEKAARARAAPGEDGGVRPKPPDEENPALTPKVKLNSICMRIVKRALQKGEVAYDTRQAIGGFHTTLKLVCLPGDWQTKAWAGKVCTTKQAAEQSAATYALETIEADESLLAAADKAKPTKDGTGNAGGKGKGKGKGKAKMDLAALEAMWGLRASGPDLEREVLTPQPVTGSIMEWKEGGSFGWIKLDHNIDHKMAERRGGKVYAHQQDMQCGAECLKTGTKVKLFVYADPAGLGAEQVTLI